jgi:hypothetical protein
MKTIQSSHKSNGNHNQQNVSISKIEAFIISRVGDLKEYGWNNQIIAEAMGVNEDFIEKASDLYYKFSY